LLTIKITNGYNLSQNQGHQQNFTIEVFSNETVFSLRKRIAHELSWMKKPDGERRQGEVPHPMSLRINRYQGSVTLKDH
jgi:hypothetical protein